MARMSMISGGDESARNAFRATLRDESSQHLLSVEESRVADVLEVKNLADAIARAEEAIRAESSRPRGHRDMFAELAASTDDTSGPAIFAPARPTPVPPPPATSDAVLIIPHDDDAFLQPAGRMRSLADDTLDGVRVDTTLEIRLRARRASLSWIVAGVITTLAFVALAVLATGRPAPPVASIAPRHTTPAQAEPPKAPPTPAPSARVVDAVPVIDVRSLPTAR